MTKQLKRLIILYVVVVIVIITGLLVINRQISNQAEYLYKKYNVEFLQ